MSCSALGHQKGREKKGRASVTYWQGCFPSSKARGRGLSKAHPSFFKMSKAVVKRKWKNHSQGGCGPARGLVQNGVGWKLCWGKGATPFSHHMCCFYHVEHHFPCKGRLYPHAVGPPWHCFSLGHKRTLFAFSISC